MFQLPLMQMVNRLNGIKNKFKKVAFIGPNPHLFLLNCPKHYGALEEFTFIEASERSVEHSYKAIEKLVNSGALPESKQPDKIEPIVMCEENEWKSKFGDVEQFDLIVSNMSLHWVNDLESTFK